MTLPVSLTLFILKVHCIRMNIQVGLIILLAKVNNLKEDPQIMVLQILVLVTYYAANTFFYFLGEKKRHKQIIPLSYSYDNQER